MKLHTIDTGFFKLDGGAMFGVVPKSIWSRLTEPDEKNLCTWAMRCLLIENGKRLILIDTGLGDKQDDKFFSYFQPHGEDTLEKSLNKHGFSPSDVTDVVLTHLHFDHCGGAIYRNKQGQLVPTFPNATYWSNEKHWDWAVNPNPREKASFLKENILPIQESGQLKFIDQGESPFNFINFRWVNGHTEAQMLPQITIGDKKIIYCADLLPSSHHIKLPYVMGYDVRPLDTLHEKAALLKNALDENAVLFFEHDKSIECASVKQTDRGILIDETFKLSELM